MTKREAVSVFKREVLPTLRENGQKDLPMRREAWNNMIDALIREGALSERAGDWTHPACVK